MLLYSLILLAVLFAPISGSRSCAAGYTQYDVGTDLVCLRVIVADSLLTQAQAVLECSLSGTDKNKGYLATPMTPEQQALMVQNTIDFRPETKTWIGLKRDSSSSDFMWADGSTLNYTNWGTGEPGQHSCAALYNDTNVGALKWKTLECETDEEVGGIICQTRVQCSPGMYSITSSKCAVCEPGSFSSFESTACTECTAGRYSPFNKSMTGYDEVCSEVSGEAPCCVGCPSGTQSSINGSYSNSSCIPCASGQYSLEGSSHCSEIPAGKYSTSTSEPQSCPRGRYSQAGASECTLCPIMTYGVDEGAKKCQECPIGRITYSPGSTSIDQCVNPGMNFLQGVVTLVIVSLLSWEYVIRGRFSVIAFMRKERVTKRLTIDARRLSKYVFLYEYKGEAQRIYMTSIRILRVLLFFSSGRL